MAMTFETTELLELLGTLTLGHYREVVAGPLKEAFVASWSALHLVKLTLFLHDRLRCRHKIVKFGPSDITLRERYVCAKLRQ
jgi:hypothetical protein